MENFQGYYHPRTQIPQSKKAFQHNLKTGKLNKSLHCKEVSKEDFQEFLQNQTSKYSDSSAAQKSTRSQRTFEQPKTVAWNNQFEQKGQDQQRFYQQNNYDHSYNASSIKNLNKTQGYENKINEQQESYNKSNQEYYFDEKINSPILSTQSRKCFVSPNQQRNTFPAHKSIKQYFDQKKPIGKNHTDRSTGITEEKSMSIYSGKVEKIKSERSLRKQTQRELFHNCNINASPSVFGKQMKSVKHFNDPIISEIYDKKQNGLDKQIFQMIQQKKLQRNQLQKENKVIKDQLLLIEKSIKEMFQILQNYGLDGIDQPTYLDKDNIDNIYFQDNFYVTTFKQQIQHFNSKLQSLDHQLQNQLKIMKTTELEYEQQLRNLQTEASLSCFKLNEYQIILDDLETNEQIRQEKNQRLGFEFFKAPFKQKNQETDQKQDIQIEYQHLMLKIIKEGYNQQDLLSEIELREVTNKQQNKKIQKLTNNQQNRCVKMETLKVEIDRRKLKAEAGKKEWWKKGKEVFQEEIKEEEEVKQTKRAQQQHLITTQSKQLNSLQFEFQEFSRNQLLSEQQYEKEKGSLIKKINQLKEQSIKIQARSEKIKKILKKHNFQDLIANFTYPIKENEAEEEKRIEIDNNSNTYKQIQLKNMSINLLSKNQDNNNHKNQNLKESIKSLYQSEVSSNLLSSDIVSQEVLDIKKSNLILEDDNNNNSCQSFFGDNLDSDYNDDRPLEWIQMEQDF